MIKKLFLAMFLFGIVIPVAAFAQVKLNLNYPNFGPFNPETNQSLGAIIGYLYYFIVGIAGLAAFVMLVWGGVQWLVWRSSVCRRSLSLLIGFGSIHW